VTRIWVSDTDSALGSRVLARLAALPRFEASDIARCEVAVYTIQTRVRGGGRASPQAHPRSSNRSAMRGTS
jgi:hypothetical protein